MRIGVNARFLIEGKLEGIGWYTYEITKRLVENYPQDEFFLFFDRPITPTFTFGGKVKPIRVFPPARHPVLWWWWFEIRMPFVLKKYGVDVFFSPDGYLSLRSKVPTVMVTHDIAHVHYPEQVPFTVRTYYDHFVPRYLERAEKIVAVSNFTKSDIEQQYQIAPDKIVTVHNGCRSHFQPLTASEKRAMREEYAHGAPFFFYLGAVHPRKNVDRLLLAFDQFKKQYPSDVKLLIAGRFAWQLERVRTVYENMAFRQDVILLGYVDDALLPKIMGSALALVYVSLFEGFGLPVLEAMQCEVPVITSDVSALSEVAGPAAITVDPRQVREIAQAMIEVFTMPDVRASLIEKGKARARSFDWNTAAEKVYDQIKIVGGQV